MTYFTYFIRALDICGAGLNVPFMQDTSPTTFLVSSFIFDKSFSTWSFGISIKSDICWKRDFNISFSNFFVNSSSTLSLLFSLIFLDNLLFDFIILFSKFNLNLLWLFFKRLSLFFECCLCLWILFFFGLFVVDFLRGFIGVLVSILSFDNFGYSFNWSRSMSIDPLLFSFILNGFLNDSWCLFLSFDKTVSQLKKNSRLNLFFILFFVKSLKIHYHYSLEI